MNSKHRKKLACLALAGTIAVTSLAMLTPSANALNSTHEISEDGKYVVSLSTGEMLEIDKLYDDGIVRTVDGSYYGVSGYRGAFRKITYIDPITHEYISKEEADIYAASWYNLACDSYTNKTLYVPIGGSVQNGSTYEENGYLRATEGSTILNRYGVDVTSVDSEMSDYEKEIAKTIHDNLDSTQVTFEQQRQMAAEMRLLEVKQIMADSKATGYEEQMKADYNTGYGGKSVYDILLMGRPDMSAKLLEMSKTSSTVYEVNPTTAASRADMAYFLMQFNSQANPDAAATAQASAMSDVQSGAWYAEAVKYCQEHGLMGGVGNSQFDPEGTVTRGQLATVIYRMEGSPAVDMSENPFTDVQPNAYYATAIEWCRQNGIITGTSKTTFAPDNAVTRQDMAVMFGRYNNGVLSSEKRISAPSDSSKQYSGWSGVAEYAEDAVKWAAECDMLHMNSTSGSRTYEDLMAEFKDYRFTEYYNTGLRVGVAGINVLPYTAAGTAEYEYFRTDSAVYEYKGGGQGTSTAHEVVVHFDHTPTLDEIAGKVYSGLGGADLSGGTRYQTAYGSAIGISYDAETNTVVAICG